MAEVYGIIGNEQVELNNAATESTLKQLLAAVMMGSKQSLDNVNKMAQKLGLDPAKVQETNTGLSSLGKGAQTLGAGYAGLSVATGQLSSAFQNVQTITKELTSGAGQASTILTMFSRIGGPLGAVFSGMSMLAEFQETQLESYRSLTQAGVNFGGSLTDLRVAAANTYMTMSQFTQMISQNGDTLVRLGGSANEGAKAFVNLSRSINSGKLGDNLRALGFTSEQINQSLLNYIALTGGRSKAELSNVESIKSGTIAYLEQLDRLASITGKNREEQEKIHKQAMFEADVQATMARMTVEERNAFNAAMKEAGDLYGQAGRDIVLAQAQGRAVTGEAGKMLMAVAPGTAKAIQSFQNVAKEYGASSRQFADISNKSQLEAAESLSQIPAAVFSTNDSFKKIGEANTLVAKNQMNGLTTKEAMDRREEDLAKQREDQRKSEASDAAQAEKKLRELGQAITEQMMPTVSRLLASFNPLIQSVADFLIPWVKIPGNVEKVIVSLIALSAGFAALKVKLAIDRAKSATRGTLTNPTIVKDISGGLGKGGIPGIEKGTGSTGGLGGKLLKGAKGLGIGAVLGLGADFAADMLGRETTAGASADVLGSAASMAGTGAMVGSIVPGLGTAIGAGIGGLAGGAYGLYQNWGTIFGSGAKPIPKPAMPEKSAVEAEISEKALSLPGITIADPMEKMAAQLERLNTQTLEMIRYLRETAEQARRNVEATRSLNGNLFPTP